VLVWLDIEFHDFFCGSIKICNSRIVDDTDWTSSTCIGCAGSTFGKHGLWRVLAPATTSVDSRGDDGV
jgi:hypothetical protein